MTRPAGCEEAGNMGEDVKRLRQKQEEAAVRQAEYDALSTSQKIARAKSRRGESRRELKRLRDGTDEE